MYIEYVFLENFLIDFFIISCCAKILNEKRKFAVLGATIGSSIACLCPIFNLNLLSSILIRISVSLSMCLLCFKCKGFKRFLCTYFLFFFVTFFFGGAAEMVKQIFGQVTVLLITLCAMIIYIISSLLIKFLNKKKVVDSFTLDVEIFDGDRHVQDMGYLDSGNLLYDPVFNKPVSLISYDLFSKLYNVDIVNLLIKKIDEKSFKNGHYITVNSAVKGGKMLVFMVDRMVIHHEGSFQEEKDVFLGLSFSKFDKAMNSKILLHSSELV